MKNFAIYGCSWGCGEWGQTEHGIFPNYGILHSGLTQYLSDAGIEVWNSSMPGDNMVEISRRIRASMDTNQHRPLTILLLQTDIIRSLAHRLLDIDSNETLSEFLDRCYFEIYQQLNSAADHYGIHIKVIGGLTDVTADLSSLSNVDVLIPSWAALADFSLQPVRVVDPKYIEIIHNNFMDRKEEKYDLINLANQRLDFFKSRPDLFWPDGHHPNRHFHKILCDHILPRLIEE